jgi:hypothetical protein
MADEPESRTFVDPALPWDGEFPYRVLERFGVAPDSPAEVVQDASFEMTAADMADAGVNLAWEQLRVPRRRLVSDFLCYHLPLEAPPSRRGAGRSGEYPLPWAFVRALAQTPPPRSEAPRVPAPALPPTLDGCPLWETDAAPLPTEGEPPHEA